MKSFASLCILVWTVTGRRLLGHASPTSGNGSFAVQSGVWKPVVLPEALTTTEFADRLNGSSADQVTADTKRSFILVYPPRATEERGEQLPPRNPQGPPLRSYPTQSRYHRMSGGTPSKKSPARVYRRPEFPPVANPPPLPEHALRQRGKAPPNFTPESSSRHQVQIQLLDGYIVPPSGGGAANAEKKQPQITTFPLNLNNVPEIRLLLPGDVHKQLTHLGHHSSDVQNSNHRQPNPLSNKNAYNFESQRRPAGRAVEQQQQPGLHDKDSYSPRDPAVYPETVNFPGQNGQQHFRTSVSDAVSYNHVKTHAGGQNRFPEGTNHDARSPGPHDGQGFPRNYGGQQNSPTENHNLPRAQEFPQNYDGARNAHTKTHDLSHSQGVPQNYGRPQNQAVNDRGPTTTHFGTHGQNFPQNYGVQSVPTGNSRSPISQTNIHDDQSFPQNYGAQVNPVNDNRTPISQTKLHDVANDPSFPQNYGAQINPANDNRSPISQTKLHDVANDQSFPQNYGAQVNPVNDNRSPISQAKLHDVANDPSFPQNYGAQINPANDNRTPISQTKLHDVANGPSFPQNYGAQVNPVNDDRSPISQTHVHDSGIGQSTPHNVGIQQNSANDNRASLSQTRIHDLGSSQGLPQNYGQNPSFDSRTPLFHAKTQGGVNVQNISPSSAGQRGPAHSKPQGQNFEGRQKFEPNGINGGPRTSDRNRASFKPLSADGGAQNGYANPQNFNRDGSVSNFRRSKINNNNNNNNSGQFYQSGWRATASNGGKKNANNPADSSSGKINFYSGSGQNRQNSFDTFGSGGDQHQKSHDGHRRPSSGQNRPDYEKSHGANYSPSGSDRDDRNRPSHEKSHFGPSSSGQDSRSGQSVPDKADPIDRKASPESSITDDVYFVPPVLTEEVQTQIEPFGDSVSRDAASASVGAPATTSRGNGNSIDQKTIADYVSLDNGPIDRQEQFCQCVQNCGPVRRSGNEDLGSTVRQIARSLNADAFFDFVGLTDQDIEDTLAEDGSYTLFVPSNEAVSRLPSSLLDHWRENKPDLRLALLNHVVRDAVSLDQLKLGGRMTSRANGATLFINNYNNEAVTVNGHRIVQGDVPAPRGGTLHVIDGTLCPVADRDIIDTLRTCNQYDGFLTLADVTKLLDTMQNEGPFTVFLPSNEALTKIPADELAVLKENSTALREFLEYHVVQGAYFSGDLKDGQYLTTVHQRQPLRVGVRVDGCYRRLVEANNSPLFKSDIPTKNGVIHVVDWILRPSDLQWCEGAVLP